MPGDASGQWGLRLARGAHASPSGSCRGVSPETVVRRDAEHHTRGRVCFPEIATACNAGASRLRACIAAYSFTIKIVFAIQLGFA